MEWLEFFVPGVPRPQGSKNRGRNGQSYEASKYLPAWRNAVRNVAVIALLKSGRVFPGAVVLDATFCFPRPRKHFFKDGRLKPSAPTVPTGRPDLSKLIRAVEDSLTDAGVWEDDSFVVDVRGRKIYATVTPGARLSIHSA